MPAFDCVCLRSDVPKRQHACCLATQSTSLVVVYVNINMVICRGKICFDFLQINSFNEICLFRQSFVYVTTHLPDNRLAITTLRTPEARSAQSKLVIARFQSYAPTLRCRRMATTRLQPFGKGKKLATPQGHLFPMW